MIFFKTRAEVKKARDDVAELRAMLGAHFNIMFTLEDFKQYCDANPSAVRIPVSVGEFLHYYKMLGPNGVIAFRTKPVVPTEASKR